MVHEPYTTTSPPAIEGTSALLVTTKGSSVVIHEVGRTIKERLDEGDTGICHSKAATVLPGGAAKFGDRSGGITAEAVQERQAYRDSRGYSC